MAFQNRTDIVEQRTPEWFAQRLGVFTASRFGDMMQQGRAKDAEYGTKCIKYMKEKLAEKLTGKTKPEVFSKSLQWGIDNEINAVIAYQEKTKCTVDLTGFKVGEEGIYGGSSDGLVGKDGLIEIKSPYDSGIHIDTMMTGKVNDKDYYYQIQGNLLCTNRTWAHFVSYDPRMINEGVRCICIKVERDAQVIGEIAERAQQCYGWVANMYDKIMKEYGGGS